MREELLEEITACLQQDRRVFHYFKDRYAFMLLEHAVGDGCSVAALKAGRFRRLLSKPSIRRLIAGCDGRPLRAADLQGAWPAQPAGYRITLGRWPLDRAQVRHRSWCQTTRRGHNLVLQLNFPCSHNRRLEALVGDAHDEFRWAWHPIARKGEITLSWARIDLDLDRGEALIEEIQSDWVRVIPRVCRAEYDAADPRAWVRYRDEVLGPHLRTWAETTLAACLWLLREEIGIRRIFFHTYESGSKLKLMGRQRPPRSLYTDLPRRFCFETTAHGPLFLKTERDRKLRRLLVDPAIRWHVLHL